MNISKDAVHHRNLKPLDERPPRGAWAPGKYMCHCVRCDQDFTGDERAVTCADCAYKDHAALMATGKTYFEQHPEAKDGVLKAYFAFHIVHFRLEPKSHNFLTGARYAKCHWCGRSREDVRYDDLPPFCSSRPTEADEPIEDMILKEELLAEDLRQRSTTQILKLTQGEAMSGELLATLHGTYGFDPEIVATVLGDLHEKHITDYHHARELERERSKAAHQPTVITAK